MKKFLSTRRDPYIGPETIFPPLLKEDFFPSRDTLKFTPHAPFWLYICPFCIYFTLYFNFPFIFNLYPLFHQIFLFFSSFYYFSPKGRTSANITPIGGGGGGGVFSNLYTPAFALEKSSFIPSFSNRKIVTVYIYDRK